MAFWLEQSAQKAAQRCNSEIHVGQDKAYFTCKDMTHGEWEGFLSIWDHPRDHFGGILEKSYTCWHMYLCIFTTGSKLWEKKKNQLDFQALRNLVWTCWGTVRVSSVMSRASRQAGLHTEVHTCVHTHIKATLLGLFQFAFTSQAALSRVAFTGVVSGIYVSDVQWSIGWKSSYNFIITHPEAYCYVSVTFTSASKYCLQNLFLNVYYLHGTEHFTDD